ncbi:MAG TPA: NUDIX domain-containing protein [Candidatus Saccharimonadales bacterium]|nr:NUDIX domain-containing protein [Candidatus Saccharimonadales bacterium]
MSQAPVLIADVVVVDNGKVLLVQQRKQVAHGLWSYPGGHVEAGETIADAVRREVHEELGAELVGAELLKVYPMLTPRGDLAIHTFTGRIKGFIRLKDDELMSYGWFSIESLQLMRDALRAPLVLEQAKDALSL